MKKILIIFFFFGTLISYAQKKDIKSFVFNETSFEYTRVDYSKYSIVQFFITMYNDIPENNLIETTSINCLENEYNLYHTLFFFLKIPSNINNLTQKNELFSKFVKHLKEEENLKMFDLYLNFDANYSLLYQLSENNVKRMNSNINPKKICKTLSIR